LVTDTSTVLDSSSVSRQWVGMRRACEILGVNQSTLRQWTDSGRVPVFLTPGGHRRYREDDLRALTARPRASAEAPLSTLLLASHERYASVARRAFQSSAWFRQFDEAARRRFRSLGNSILGLLSTYVITTSRRERERSLERAGEVAAEYGQVAASLGLSLAETTEAFVLFRGPVLETVERWLREQQRPGLETGETLKRVNRFMDQVLLSMATAHEQRSTAARSEGTS